MNETHELMIQRLIDNELDEQGRREFLNQAELNPELWRLTTLAFVEDRIWSSVVQERTDPRSIIETDNKAAVVGGAGTERVSTVSTIAVQKPWWLRYGPQLLMTAASFLFVLTLALRFNPVEEPSAGSTSDDVVSGTPDSNDEAAPLPPLPPLPPLGPDGSQLVSQPYSLRLNETDFPVFDDPEQFQAEIKRVGQLDPVVVERFQSAGYQIYPDVRYIAGRLTDGRRVVLPVQSFRIGRMGQ